MEPGRDLQETDFLVPLLGDLFIIEAVYRHDERWAVTMSYRFDRAQTNRLLEERLRHSGYRHSLQETDSHLTLVIDPRRRFQIPPLNLILFMITLISVYFVPVFFRSQVGASSLGEVFDRTVEALGQGAGIEFTLAIMSILLVHEMGHYIAGRRRGIITSWPYFIPAPNLIGTFGAVIKSKSPFWNRRDLIEVGASGPIAGWLVAVGWLIYGLSKSVILPEAEIVPGMVAFTMEGESLLIQFLVPILTGSAMDGTYYVFTEAAFAGWVGLFVTAINMLPIGQFDGGHVLYGLVTRRQTKLAWVALAGLGVLGFQSNVWWLFAALGLFFGVSHPPTMDDGRPITRATLAMGVVAIGILVVSLTPIPVQ